MMNEKRIVLTGGEGMIARSLPFGIKLSRSELDVLDERQVKDVISSLRPSVVVHLAALDIRQCETDPRAGYATNVLGTYNVALAAREIGARLLFLSSGTVFSGPRGTTHTEASRSDPVNVYGQTKQVAEILLQETLDDLLIIRTGWVFGGRQAHHPKFADVAILRAIRGEPIQATTDQWGSPTYVKDLGRELERLAASATTGVLHVVNEGGGSGMDMAMEIVRTLESTSPIIPTSRHDILDPGPARPESEVLSSATQRLRPWREALHEYVLETRAPR